MQATQRMDLPRWLPSRIQQLEEERDRLETRLRELPPHQPKVPSKFLGYHSPVASPNAVKDGGAEWYFDINFPYGTSLDSIAMAPAFNQLEPEKDIYAFPKRFRIEVLNFETKEYETVVDWTSEDFPHPGSYPVFFADISRYVKQVRIRVPRTGTEAGEAFFALGELYLFHRGDDGVGENMSVWPPVEFAAPKLFSIEPLWDIKYLHDNFSGLGLPLGAQQEGKDDFIVWYGEGAGKWGRAELTLDLGQVREVGRVELWPAAAPSGVAVPSFGFPHKVTVQLSSDPTFSDPLSIEEKNVWSQMMGNNRLVVFCKDNQARYIRIILQKMITFEGQRILGLGEISVARFGREFSVGCDISAKGIPEEMLVQLPQLVDGYARSRLILKEGEWIRGLALRRPLDRRLAVVERELEAAREAWGVFKVRGGIFGGGLLCFGLLGAMGLQRLQRRKVLNGLKTRITRDLHDEVGSSLGGISLTSEGLEEMTNDEVVKQGLDALSLMAREACASLREVIWVTDQDQIRLPALVEKLVERAERILHGIIVETDLAPDIPDRVVSWSCKRHIVMLFREAVHNCARHAEAQTVRISVRTPENRFLELSIQDDGQGFDRSKIKRGLGLESMKERAEELRGVLELQSAPGEGTLVKLKLPLNALSLEPTMAYKTSN